MTSSETVEMFCILAQNTGKSKNSTVNKEFDATSCETITTKVFMDYGFSKVEIDPECGPIPPDPEMIEVEIECIWGTEIRLKGESFKAKGYYDKGWCWIEGLMSRNHEENIGAFEIILRRMIREGDWKGIDKRTLEEDPMGCLSDYE